METEKKMTGFASIDKPWLKYYTEEAINAPLPECTIYEYLWENNKDHLDDVALIYFGKKITYGELFKNIDKTARAFSAIGVKNGDMVVICSVATPELIYSMYALNRLGAAANIIDPRTNTKLILRFIEESKAKAILSIDKCLPKVKIICETGFAGAVIMLSAKDSLPFIKKALYSVKDKENIKLGVSWQQFIANGKKTEYLSQPYKRKNPATVIYTSGTTGTPKGAILTDDTLNTIAFQYRILGADYNRTQKFLDVMPPFIAYGVACGLHMPLSLGLTDVIIPMLNPDELDRLIVKYKPAHYVGVPSHYEKLAQSPKMKKFDLSFWESAGAGGDTISESTEQRINEFLISHGSKYPVAKGYGMTELGSAAVTCHGNVNKLGSVGIPHCKTVVSIFKPDTEEELSYNTEGEICFCTNAMMIGYLRNDVETSKVIKMHSDGKRWVHSGDIGYIDEDGFVFIKGRIKRIIVRSDGHNVWPGQIEDVLMQLPQIKSCCVVGAKSKSITSGVIPTAFIVLNDGVRTNEEFAKMLHEYQLERLPERDIALQYRFIDQMPLTPIGKVDYRALEQQAESM